MKKLVSILMATLLVLGIAGAAMAEGLVVANLPKSVGGAWFNRMAVGIETYGEESGNEAFQTGADKGDAALQVKEVENLIAQMVDVLTIVPVSPEALEPVLTKAREAGIVVISHEAQGITNVDYDVEAFDGAAYGAHLMDLLAESMGEEGDYIISVGSLTAASHMSWANGALARQTEDFASVDLQINVVQHAMPGEGFVNSPDFQYGIVHISTFIPLSSQRKSSGCFTMKHETA